MINIEPVFSPARSACLTWSEKPASCLTGAVGPMFRGGLLGLISCYIFSAEGKASKSYPMLHVWNMFLLIFHELKPNLGKYSIHGTYGL